MRQNTKVLDLCEKLDTYHANLVFSLPKICRLEV